MVWRAAGTQTLEIPAAPQVQHSRTLIPGASPGPESAGSGPWSSAPPVRWRVLHTYLTGATRGSDGVASGDGAASGFGAALLAVEGGGESARVVVHGIADADAESRLRLVLLAAVEGVSSASGCRDLPPQVVLAPLANTDRILAPSTMQLRWKTRAAGSLVSRADLRFGVLYSSDAGATWRYAQDGEPAVVGAHHPERYCVRDAAAGTGTTELVMAMPAARFVGGPLLVRVEAWRDGYGQHYSYHMREVELRR
jgi:hypothetical protein